LPTWPPDCTPALPRPPPRPNGAPCDSPGQRPGNSAPPNQTSPERARFHAAILRPNPRAPSPRRTGRRGRPAAKYIGGQESRHWLRKYGGACGNIRRGSGSRFALSGLGWLGGFVPRALPWAISFGRVAANAGPIGAPRHLAALRPMPAPLAHSAALPRCGQHRPRWRNPAVLPRCGQRRTRWSICSVLPRSDTGRRTKGRIMIAHTPAPQRGAMR